MKCSLKASGIYKITCLVTNKVYIGSTSNFRRRLNEHKSKLSKGYHSSIKLQRAFDKYGEENFLFEIVEECSVHIMEQREQYYLDLLKPHINGYNINSNARNCYGIVRSSEFKEKCRIRQTGVVYGESTKEKHRKRLKDLQAKGIIQKGRPLKPCTNGLEVFSSIKEASDKTGFDSSSIAKACKGILKLVGGYKWTYVADN